MRENGIKTFDLNGVFEDMDVPSLGGCLGAMRTPRKLPNFFSQLDIRIHFKEYGLWRAVFGLQDPQINFYWIKKVSIPIHFIHWTRWCVPKNPYFTHLPKKRFFGTACIFGLISMIFLNMPKFRKLHSFYSAKTQVSFSFDYKNFHFVLKTRTTM